MIKFTRKKESRWIFHKNVSSKEIIEAFVSYIQSDNQGINLEETKENLKYRGLYSGRSRDGSANTMGVRLSQMCFYMFGYKCKKSDEKNKLFIPSPMTLNMLDKKCEIPKNANALVNLFSIQYPHPFSKTPDDFEIYAGRLIVKLLLDEKIEKKLYIDEFIWFLPFIKQINKKTYDELIESIIEYRRLSYNEKKKMFESIRNYEDVFSNITHEINYYFLPIFSAFNVLDIVPDSEHNQGNLFKFKHGNTTSYRSDKAGKCKVSGYINLSKDLEFFASELVNRFSPFEKPSSMKSDGIFTQRDLLIRLYETEPLQYLNVINKENSRTSEVSSIINNMLYTSKYGSRDGAEFEKSLKQFMELFEETCDVEIIAGPGNTDLLCSMEDSDNNIYKMNIDAKTRKNALNEINARRIDSHINKHGSSFCMIVAPKFSKGVNADIFNHKIVTIKADDLAAYCYRECISSKSGYANFSNIYNIIKNNLGKDITELVREYVETRYGVSI